MKLICMVDWASDLSEMPNKSSALSEIHSRNNRLMKYYEQWRQKQDRDWRLILWHAHYPGRWNKPKETIPADSFFASECRDNLFDKMREAVAKNISDTEAILLANDSFYFSDSLDLEPYLLQAAAPGAGIIPVNGGWLIPPSVQPVFAQCQENQVNCDTSGQPLPPSDWSVEDFLAWAERSEWIFAKTYAESAPHEYAVAGRGATLEDLYQATMFILRNGFVQMFYQNPFFAYQVNNRRYWSCGGYGLINRTLEGDLKVYK